MELSGYKLGHRVSGAYFIKIMSAQKAGFILTQSRKARKVFFYNLSMNVSFCPGVLG
jgi:hypothetical protein